MSNIHVMIWSTPMKVSEPARAYICCYKKITAKPSTREACRTTCHRCGGYKLQGIWLNLSFMSNVANPSHISSHIYHNIVKPCAQINIIWIERKAHATLPSCRPMELISITLPSYIHTIVFMYINCVSSVESFLFANPFDNIRCAYARCAIIYSAEHQRFVAFTIISYLWTYE